jgi:multidrug resistance efflux pump
MISNLFNQIKSFFIAIWNFVKRPFVWIWNLPIFAGVRKLLTWLWRILVPLLLLGLLVVPIYLTYNPNTKKNNSLNVPKVVAKSDVTKKISVQATVQNNLAYELPVFQDATIKEVTVNQGDKVKEGQVLAKLEFVTENTLRSTDVQNQINSYYTDIANNREAFGKALNTNNATLNQQDTNLITKTAEWNTVNQRRVDKINENNAKRFKYDSERADYQKQYDELDARKIVDSSVKQYEDQIKKLRDTQNSTQTGQVSQAQVQINTTRSQIDGFKLQLGLTTSQSCSAYSFISGSAAPDLTSVKNQCVTTEQNLNELINQQNIASNNQNNTTNANVRDINDLQNKINELKKDPNYTGNRPNVTDQLNDAQIEAKKQDLKSKITTREADIKIIDNSVEIKTYEDQLKTIERFVTDTLAQQDVSRNTIDSTNSGILQRIKAAQTSLAGSQQKLNDVLEDVAKQEKNKTIIAKKDGIVGKINVKQGLQANARDSVFSMVSEDYLLQFTVSADNRALIKNGMRVITDKFPELKDIQVTEANIVPNATTAATVANSTIEYTIKAGLPKTDKYFYTQGSTVNIDVIVDDKEDVISVPTTAVSEGKVYVGTNPILPKPVKDESKKEVNEGDPLAILDEPQEPESGTSGDAKPGTNSASSSSKNTDQLKGIKFREIKEVKVESGLDDGRNIEIKSGLNKGEYVFSIFPKTDAEKKTILTEYIETK